MYTYKSYLFTPCRPTAADMHKRFVSDQPCRWLYAIRSLVAFLPTIPDFGGCRRTNRSKHQSILPPTRSFQLGCKSFSRT